MKSILILLLFSSLSFSQEDHCTHNHTGQMKELADFAKKLEWKAASISNVRKAPCTKDEPFTVSEMSSWLKAKQSKPNQNRNIHGIKFENESQENLETFEFLTTARTYWGEIDSKNQKTFKSSCKKVECAVKEFLDPKLVFSYFSCIENSG